MHIAIVFDKRENLHYLLRVVPRQSLLWNTETDCLRYLDSLLSAKLPSQLLQAIDEMPSLYPEGMFGGVAYWHEIDEALNDLQGFSVCNAPQLEAELQIISVKEVRSNNTHLNRLMADYGTSGLEYAKSLKYVNGKECVLLIERLQDWMTLHASLTLCARLRAQIEDNPDSVSLENAGFGHRVNTRLDDDFFLIPFKFNAFYAREHTSGSDNDPLFNSLAPWKKSKTAKLSPIDQVYVRELGDLGDSVFFATAPIATQQYPKKLDEIFVARRRAASMKTYYLLARDNVDEGLIAKRIVSSFTHAFRTLVDPGDKKRNPRELGWVYDEEGEFEGLAGPRLAPKSLISALWLQLVYHPGMRTITCGYCGNAVLARERGNQKQYCSSSCRVQDAKRLLKEKEGGAR